MEKILKFMLDYIFNFWEYSKKKVNKCKILYKLRYRIGSLNHHSERIASRISGGNGSFSIIFNLIASSSSVNCTSEG